MAWGGSLDSHDKRNPGFFEKSIEISAKFCEQRESFFCSNMYFFGDNSSVIS